VIFPEAKVTTSLLSAIACHRAVKPTNKELLAKAIAAELCVTT
jgi:hypothetical protein